MAFTPFLSDISEIDLPQDFTYPFYYSPHPLSLIACQELQDYLKIQTDFKHNFGFDEKDTSLQIGKMFGVLVVKNQSGKLGYLAAFSGKLADENHHKRFVPPVFDLLEKDNFFRIGEVEVNDLTLKIQALESDKTYLQLKANLDSFKQEMDAAVALKKQALKTSKKQRDEKRALAKTTLNEAEQLLLIEQLKTESIREQLQVKDFIREINLKYAEIEGLFLEKEQVILQLKEERANKSSRLQKEIFEQYTFLNQAQKTKSLLAIFEQTVFQTPPAGAGECAAPKLLQYAFLNQLQPICMAEFWWGKSPSSEVRLHGQYYPACRGKCEPILAHMLEGISLEKNPMLEQASVKEIPVVYEDEYLLLINKPPEFLSVPGKELKDSVYERMRLKYPNASGPLLVHRLDMSTSGLLLVAKSEEIYKQLQSQFIRRNVKKSYIALLDGIVDKTEGDISLPLRVDLEDRPKQLVCYEHGKNAYTKYKVLEIKNGKTRIQFFPITGRTHQLRVHAAHHLGLNCPIIGDDLYGTKSERLCLHAQWIQFKHPISKEIVEFSCEPNF
ncbi:MAG: RNA pseudouridine synthase [Flavobacteriales bacterium]|nr:RNA pseudouridine synthase [Flavobacteriales bacterium]